MAENWVIAGKPDGTVPEVGKVYEIRDSRKGTYKAKILDVYEDRAQVEVTEGIPHFASFESRVNYQGVLAIRASLVYLIEQETSPEVKSEEEEE